MIKPQNLCLTNSEW